MRALPTLTLLGLTALLSALPALAATPAMLEEADRVRATEPARFERLLVQLERGKSSLSEGERRRLRLLQNYRRVIRGDYEQATSELAALFDEAPEPDIKYRAGLLVANTTAITREFVTSLRYLERAMALRHQVSGETRDVGDEVAGSTFNQFGQYSLALHHADALLSRETTPRTRCIARQIRIHAIYSLGRQLDQQDVREALRGCAAQNEVIAVNLIRGTVARQWAKSDRQAQAIAMLRGGLAEVEATGYTHLIADHHSLLAEVHLARNEIASASAHARRATSLQQEGASALAAVAAHRVLYEIALQRGELASALKHYRAYAEADKSYLDEVRAREYAFHLTRHEINQKNQSIELLSNQNQVLRLQQEVAKRSSWNFRLAIALLLVLAASAAYWGWRARRTHRSLRQLANTDGLTGLSNRRHFRARSEAVLALCAQRNRPVSMLLFDLDHFKQINDQCGHSSGDWVLREVARVGRKHCREGDLFGRIGGEEYAMALVDCDVDAALRIAEQCRISIEGIDASAAGCGLPVAASIGVVGTTMSGYDYETLIAHADAAMYRSKVAGRNRVSIYQPPPVPENGLEAVLDSRNAAAMLKEY